LPFARLLLPSPAAILSTPYYFLLVLLMPARPFRLRFIAFPSPISLFEKIALAFVHHIERIQVRGSDVDLHILSYSIIYVGFSSTHYTLPSLLLIFSFSIFLHYLSSLDVFFSFVISRREALSTGATVMSPSPSYSACPSSVFIDHERIVAKYASPLPTGHS